MRSGMFAIMLTIWFVYTKTAEENSIDHVATYSSPMPDQGLQRVQSGESTCQ